MPIAARPAAINQIAITGDPLAGEKGKDEYQFNPDVCIFECEWPASSRTGAIEAITSGLGYSIH